MVPFTYGIDCVVLYFALVNVRIIAAKISTTTTPIKIFLFKWLCFNSSNFITNTFLHDARLHFKLY